MAFPREAKLVNAVSSIAYALAAGSVLYIGGEYAAVVAIGLAALAIGSALYHGTGKRWAQSLDEIGMYAASIPLMWAAVDQGATVPFIYLVMLVHFVLFATLHRAIDSFIAMPLLILVAIGFAGTYGSALFALLALTVFGLAVGLRSYDTHNGPAHWVWHGLTGLAFVLLFAAI